ncbi:MAG: hypothetical protein V4449_00540 [Patescibacteria group bacterium]
MGPGHKEKSGPSGDSPATEEFPTKIPGEGPGHENIDWNLRAALRAQERFEEEGEFDDD